MAAARPVAGRVRRLCRFLQNCEGIAPERALAKRVAEVDIVLERDDGAIAGIEVKASATVTAGDFSGLKKLAEAADKRFAFGVVLYDGDTIVPFGERLAATPVSCLWH